MDSSGTSLIVWSYGLAVMAYLAFGVRLLQLDYLKRPRETVRSSLVLAVFLTMAWAMLFLLGQVLASPRLVLWSDAFDLARYAGWAAFLLGLMHTERNGQTNKSMVWLGRWAVLLLVLAVLFRLMAVAKLDWAGDARRWILWIAVAIPILTLVLVEQLFANVTEDSRWNVKPMCLGIGGFALFDLYMYSQALLFSRLDSDALDIRGAVHALMLPLLWLASTRRSNWLKKIQISRQVAFHSATLLIAGGYLLFVSAIGYYVRYFGGEWGRALQLGLVFVGLLTLAILVLSGGVRARLRVFLGKHFFRYRYDYREEWLRFTRTLSMQNSPQEMGQQIVRGLAELLESPGGGLWMRNREQQHFSQISNWNLRPVDAVEPQDSALSRFLVSSGWVVNLEEFRSFPRRYGDLTLPVWLRETQGAWLIVPLIVSEELIGFVVLARARTRIEVNWEVNDLLKTAGRQAASFLAQMQATEALLEARKFDAFNRMSAFVVHDLKNIVTQLSLMMKNAQRHANNPEFQKDMLLTVENSLDRMRQMMMQLREGATPPGSAAGVDLVQMIRQIEIDAKARGRNLQVDVQDVIGARGHAERLHRVMGHVVQNALEATPSTGEVSIILMREGSWAKVEVRDSGHGMSPEFLRDRLFKPFQSTKRAGMGIGAYESYQYVQELGGKIDVESEVGKGTCVCIRLPLFEIRVDSDLHTLENS